MTNALTAKLEDLRTLVDSRARDIEELRNDRVTLGMELDALKLKVRLLTLYPRDDADGV